MNRIKFITLILALVCLGAGCEQEPVTYRFTNMDKLKLLPHYTEGKIFTFQNEDGEERKFEVTRIQERISSQHWISSGCGGNCIDYFYCESKNILLIDLETQHAFYLTFARFPINYDEAIRNSYSLQPSSLMGIITNEAVLSFDYFLIYLNLEEIENTFNCNGITYTAVHIIRNDEAEESYGRGMLIDAKMLYYDIYQGLIGFDDVNNHHWRLKNK